MESLYEQLPDAGKKIARIPRFGRLIGLMKKPQLARLTSNAAVYWELFTYVSLETPTETGLIDSGLMAKGASRLGWHKPESVPFEREKNHQRHWQVRLGLNILAAVAYEMMCGESGDGTSAPLETVDSKQDDDESAASEQTANPLFDTEVFLHRVRDRLVRAGAYVGPGEPLDPDRFMADDWDCLKHMNSAGLEYNVFSDTDSRILFTDISVRNFLAAYWVSRWSQQDGKNEFLHWYPHWAGENQNTNYQEFWDLVVQIRELKTIHAETPPFTSESWYHTIAPLFDKNRQVNSELPVRPTELMYRTRQWMKDTAAWQAFHNEFQSLLAGKDDRSNVAGSILYQPLSLINRAKAWLSTTGICSRPNDSQFVRLAEKGSKLPRDTGEFLMGSPDSDNEPTSSEKPQHKVRLAPFALNRFCVTNEQLELFDPIRRQHREFSDEVDEGALSLHPVVDVTWFDCWWFTQWIGQINVAGSAFTVQLPSEAQWEYACRCGLDTRYTWADGSDNNEIQEFNANYGLLIGIGAKRTIPVDGEDKPAGKQISANPWGMFQMHGNVWEWCNDWFASYPKEEASNPLGPSTGTARVLRGGSWINGGRNLRSAYRNWDSPSFRDWILGFRLAAVPLSAASSAEQA